MNELLASLRRWRELMEAQDRINATFVAATVWTLRELEECQRDLDEYHEEMSLGGRPYRDPSNYGSSR